MTNTMGRKILYDGKPVQVDSAVRDGTGLNINNTYVCHAEFGIETVAGTTSGSVQVSTLNLYGKTPRIVQIFDNNGNIVGADVTIVPPTPPNTEVTQITYNIIGTTAGQDWVGRVTAW